MNANDLRKHNRSLVTNPKEWLNLDFEVISDYLGIEVNSAMSPTIVRLCIEGRFNEMSSDEYSRIPEVTLDHLAKLNTLGKFELQYTRNSTARYLHPFKLIKDDKNKVALSPVGTTMTRFEDLIERNEGLSTYLCESNARVIFGGESVIIISQDFYPFTEQQLLEIFKSFDHYALTA